MRGILTRMRDRRASSRGRGGGLSTRLGRGERRRRSLRLSLGLSVFGALLALGLLGMLVLGATVFFETRALEKRGHLAAVQLAVLAEAAASHAHSRFPALLTQAQVGPSELTVAGLKAAGALPQEFSETDALGRGYRVLMLAAGADAFDLLVTETVGPGDTVRPAAAPLQATGPRIGLAGPSRLSGPTVDADMGAFRAAFAGAPGEGALAALRRFDHGGVFGDALYRVAIPGFAEANRMEADLDMGGNAIEGAGTVEAARLEVETDVEAGGDLTVTQVLLPNPNGGRTALREWLAFDAGLKAALLESPQAVWPARIAAALAGTGNDLAAAARKAHAGGLIEDEGMRRIFAGCEAMVGGGA